MNKTKHRKIRNIARIIALILFIPILLFLTNNFSDSHDHVIEQNKLLHDQIDMYKKIINNGIIDLEENKEYFDIIKVCESKLKFYKIPYGIGQNGWLWIIIGTFIIFYFVLRYIDKKFGEIKKPQNE